MGTKSSDLRLITRKHFTSSPAPANPLQCSDAERDMSDGGGAGFVLFLLALVLSTLAWCLV